MKASRVWATLSPSNFALLPRDKGTCDREENMKGNTLRTFIYKIGDIEADSKIESILGEGWRLSAVTPNGTVRIATFNKDNVPTQIKTLRTN